MKKNSMKKDMNIELLSPAGNIDSFYAAINSGADAIYMGVNKFNARQMAKNFEIDEYIECILNAHLRNVKIYLTLNILLNDDEIQDALKLVAILYSKGLDGIIVQDLGFAKLLHELIPDLPLHASTQMGVYSIEQINILKELGFKRVVLARELSLSQIEEICQKTDVEIEVFVHGALCMSYSGQCMLSYFIGKRSANRGSCAQPCRMKYSLYSKSSKDPIYEGKYLLSKKDIFGIKYINKLKQIGVTSLKIEGRNKVPEYVAGVTSIYREYIDNKQDEEYVLVDKKDEKNLLQLFNRNGMSSGYLNGNEYKSGITDISPKNTGLYLGKVILQKDRYVKVLLEEDIDMHDGIEIYSYKDVISNIVTCIKDSNFKLLNSKVEKGNTVWIGDISNKVKIGSKVYRTSSKSLNDEINKKFLLNNNQRKNKFNVLVVIEKNKKIKAVVNKLNLSYSLDYIPDIAKNKCITSEDIIKAFSKTNDTAFEFDKIDTKIDDELFVPTSKLNELRRGIIDKLINSYIITKNITDLLNRIENKKYVNYQIKDNNTDIDRNYKCLNSLYVYKYNSKVDYMNLSNVKDIGNYDKNPELIYFSITDYIKNEKDIIKKYVNKVKVFIHIPNVVGENVSKNIAENIEEYIKKGIKGFLIGSLQYIDILNNLKKKYNITIVGDYTLNVYNIFSAESLKELGVDVITPSLEVNEKGFNDISKILPIELVKDYSTVVTSKYCVLGSYVSNRTSHSKCKCPCISDDYYLKDSYGFKYNIVCDNMDCIMRLIIKVDNDFDFQDNKIKNICSIRRCII